MGLVVNTTGATSITAHGVGRQLQLRVQKTGCVPKLILALGQFNTENSYAVSLIISDFSKPLQTTLI